MVKTMQLPFLLFILSSIHVHCLQQDNHLLFPLHNNLQWSHPPNHNSPLPCPPPRSRREKNGIILEMKHQRHCSHEDELIEIPKSAQIPLKSGIQLKTLNYIVSIKLGNRKMTMIIDTGSDLTWTQCKPCFSCYIQQGPLFDPHLSLSYRNISCNSSTCIALEPVTSVCTTKGANCDYALSYGDGSYTLGVLGKDKIDLGGIVVEEFIFGCGRSNHGLFGGVSGIIGLGRTQLSLVSQTINQFGGVFSYCLPTRAFNSSGSLILGNDPALYRNISPISYTKLVSGPLQLPFYFVNLTGMIIGGERLDDGLFNGRVLIDSGTVITRLAPSVYKALRDVFVKRFSGYPPAPPFSILDTCFDLSGYEEVKVPTMKFEFEGDAELSVDVTGILYIVKRDASQVCLAVSSLESEDGVGIIGNFQQKNLRVVYDSAGSKLGFAKEICGYDHQN
ncbi:putative nepenthesin [Dioscorea sansibarensis]